MQIEAGKSYRTRDGRKVGPMEQWYTGVEHPFRQSGGPTTYYAPGGDLWRADGTSYYCGNNGALVAEWSEPNTTTAWRSAAWFLDIPAESSPVRKEITSRTVIVDGLYGIVAVYHEQDQVRVTLTREDGTPDQLEAAARTLQQLAEALREG